MISRRRLSPQVYQIASFSTFTKERRGGRNEKRGQKAFHSQLLEAEHTAATTPGSAPPRTPCSRGTHAVPLALGHTVCAVSMPQGPQIHSRCCVSPHSTRLCMPLLSPPPPSPRPGTLQAPILVPPPSFRSISTSFQFPCQLASPSMPSSLPTDLYSCDDDSVICVNTAR